MVLDEDAHPFESAYVKNYSFAQFQNGCIIRQAQVLHIRIIRTDVFLGKDSIRQINPQGAASLLETLLRLSPITLTIHRTRTRL